MKKRLFALVLVILLVAVIVPVSASAAGNPLVVDEAGALNSRSFAELTKYAESVSNHYGCDVAVVFVPDTNGQDIMDFADDYFDYNGYGAGSDDSGIMLVVALESREYWITTHATAIKVFTDARIEKVQDRIEPYLVNNEWADAADQFISGCEEFLELGIPGKKLSPMAAPISVIVGLIFAMLPMNSMKSQLKPVAQKRTATDYIPEGGVHITASQDMFLYHTQRRRKVEKSSSGSSTHTSSSGQTHGGGGGRF